MKTVIILLCVVLIGFGYLLSDYGHAQNDLVQLQQLADQMEQKQKALEDQLAKAQQANSDLAQQKAAQDEMIRQLRALIADQRKQLAELQTRVALMQILGPAQKSLPSVVQAGMFLPILPAVLATAFIVLRSRHPAPRNSKRTTGPRSTLVQLTDDELQELIRLRRKQER